MPSTIDCIVPPCSGFVGKATIVAKSFIAGDASVEEQAPGADATGAAATAAKAVAPKVFKLIQ